MAKKNNGVNFLEVNGLTGLVRDMNSSVVEQGDQKKEDVTKQKESVKKKDENEKKPSDKKTKAQNVDEGILWDNFIENVTMYKANPTKGTAVWLDEEIIASLQLLKNGSIKAPVRAIANAIIRAFIDANIENCKKNTRKVSGLF